MADVGQFTDFITSAVRMAIPLHIAAMGLVVSERAGMMNIGVEGVMLMGAFAGYTGAKLTGSYWFGILLAILVSILIVSIFAITTITFKAKQVIVGAAINLLSAGLSSFLYRLFFYNTGRLNDGVGAPSFSNLHIPVLSDIPVIGPLLFSYNIIVYFALAMTVILWIIMNKTSWGMMITAVGEHPKAADSLGINVVMVRYIATAFSGAMFGIAGAYLSIAQAAAFGENMTTGRGFIAMAVVILGKWNPMGVLAGAFLFGGANALQLLFQISGVAVPKNIIMMVPYIATIIAVLLVSKKKVTAPAALGTPYEKT